MNLTEIINYITASNNSAFFYTPKIYKTGESILFKSPVEIVSVTDKSEFTYGFKTINSLLKKGLTGYGLINYETGYLLEEKLYNFFNKRDQSILKFFFFENNQIEKIQPDEIDYNSIKDFLDSEEYLISNFKLNTSKSEYIENINRIRNYIKEGDTYQINYTVKGKFDFYGSLQSLFLSLIFNQSAQYSALINNGGEYVISISPELFFEVKENKIFAKPMKGTIRRGYNNFTDKINSETLLNSKKDRAENVMILDLLRNDLGKISKLNSVKVTSSFTIEKYESLFQMISCVESELTNTNIEKILKNIFPCGSITGAPKIRTMEIINEIENEPRGIYTGAIGIIGKDQLKFNVPIRTISISKSGKGEIGLGSGVVWDSDPEEEYKETLLKSDFIIKPDHYFELFESILIENGKPFLLEEHLQRLKESADYFLFNYDYEKVKDTILSVAESVDISRCYKLKINLDKWGKVTSQNSIIEKNRDNVRIIISEERINSKNKYQYFKTTNRKLYDYELQKFKNEDFYDVIFLNEKDEISEGSFTNIFIKLNNKWLTPKIKCGILNGVYRQYLLNDKTTYSESILKLDNLRNVENIIITNSVRKIVSVKEVLYMDEIIYSS